MIWGSLGCESMPLSEVAEDAVYNGELYPLFNLVTSILYSPRNYVTAIISNVYHWRSIGATNYLISISISSYTACKSQAPHRQSAIRTRRALPLPRRSFSFHSAVIALIHFLISHCDVRCDAPLLYFFRYCTLIWSTIVAICVFILDICFRHGE
jgi:hypothetical protein